MKKLKTLDEHNRSQHFLWIQQRTPQQNGIACPQCGAEMIDSAPGVTLTSNPVKYHVHCPADGCGYRGYRL